MITSFSNALRIFSASLVQFAFHKTLKCSVIELMSVLFIFRIKKESCLYTQVKAHSKY